MSVLFPSGLVLFFLFRVRAEIFVPLSELVVIMDNIGFLRVFGQEVVGPGVAVEFVDYIGAELLLEVVQLVRAYGEHSAYYLACMLVHIGGNQVL